MKKYFAKSITIILSAMIIIGLCGCEKEESIAEKPTWWSSEIVNENEELYAQIIGLRTDFRIPQKLHRSNADMEKYMCIGDALTWQMKRYIDDNDKKYHVLIQYFDINEDPNHDGSIPREIVDSINEKYDTDFNLDDWVEADTMMGIQYYYVFTAEEIFALSDFGIFCRYIGSGEGDIEDVNFDTEEGIATFFELYGDGMIRYEDGMTRYY